jgi:hypothetical protein
MYSLLVEKLNHKFPLRGHGKLYNIKWTYRSGPDGRLLSERGETRFGKPKNQEAPDLTVSAITKAGTTTIAEERDDS